MGTLKVTFVSALWVHDVAFVFLLPSALLNRNSTVFFFFIPLFASRPR